MGKGAHADAKTSTCPFDLDDVFAYETFKVVRIRDRRLGLARLAITLAIFIYIVVYLLIIEQGYLRKEAPQGVVTTSLKRGVKKIDGTLPNYCTDGLAGTKGTDTIGAALPCLWMDEVDALHPSGEEFSMFISTRITVSETQPAAADCRGELTYVASNPPRLEGANAAGTVVSTCQEPTPFSEINTNQGRPYYVGDIEDFTMQWGHAVYGEEAQSVHHSTDLHSAELEDTNDGDISFDDRSLRGAAIQQAIDSRGYVGISTGDILTIRRFLEPAKLGELGLDRIARTSEGIDCTVGKTSGTCPSGCFWPGPRCEAVANGAIPACDPAVTCVANTLRYDGGVFLVMVEYQTPGMTNLGYKYKVTWIEKAEYKLIEKIPSGAGTKYYNRHGIRIVFVQTGFLTTFSFPQVLVTLVSGVALFAMAKIIVEVVIMRILPAKHVYENYKYTTTKDFDDVHVTAEDPLGGCSHQDFAFGMPPTLSDDEDEGDRKPQKPETTELPPQTEEMEGTKGKSEPYETV